jgi:hypothetical protein
MGYIVQSIVFDKDKGWDMKSAREWVKNHKEFSKPIKEEETINTIRVRLFPPKKAEQMGFKDYRMKTLASGDVGIMLDIAYNKLKGNGVTYSSSVPPDTDFNYIIEDDDILDNDQLPQAVASPTPYNSNSNLLLEQRLIDTGNFNIVNFNNFVSDLRRYDGTIPPKLIRLFNEYRELSSLNQSEITQNTQERINKLEKDLRKKLGMSKQHEIAKPFSPLQDLMSEELESISQILPNLRTAEQNSRFRELRRRLLTGSGVKSSKVAVTNEEDVPNIQDIAFEENTRLFEEGDKLEKLLRNIEKKLKRRMELRKRVLLEAEKEKIIARLQEIENKMAENFQILTGGSLANEDLQALLAKSYHSKHPSDYKDFQVDKELSGQRVQVYHNPTTQQTIVAHRGTSSVPNWIENVAYAVSNDKSGKAFQHSKKIQDQAYSKYGKENITTIGHSKGALHAQEYGKEGKEVITLNKPVNITDALFTRVPKSQTDIRTQYDPVSFLRPFQRGNKAETIKSTTKNPLAEHKTSVLGRLDPRRLFGSSMMCPHCGVNCCCGMMRGGMVEEEEDVGIIDKIIDIETEPYNEKIQQLRYSLRNLDNRLRRLGYMSRGTIEGNEIEGQIILLKKEIDKFEGERDKLIEDIRSQNIMERLRDREIKKGRGMSGGVSIQFSNGLFEFNTSSPYRFYRSVIAYYFLQRPQRKQEFQQALRDAPNFVRQQERGIIRDFQNNWNEFLDILNGDNMTEKRRIVGATEIDIGAIIDAVIDGSVYTESEGELSSSDEEEGAGMSGGSNILDITSNRITYNIDLSSKQGFYNTALPYYNAVNIRSYRIDGNTYAIRDVVNQWNIENPEWNRYYQETIIPKIISSMKTTNSNDTYRKLETFRNNMTKWADILVEYLDFATDDENDYPTAPNTPYDSDEDNEVQNPIYQEGAGMYGGAGLTPFSQAEYMDYENVFNSTTSIMGIYTKLMKFINKHGGNKDIVRQRLISTISHFYPHTTQTQRREFINKFDRYANLGEDEGAGMCGGKLGELTDPLTAVLYFLGAVVGIPLTTYTFDYLYNLYQSNRQIIDDAMTDTTGSVSDVDSVIGDEGAGRKKRKPRKKGGNLTPAQIEALKKKTEAMGFIPIDRVLPTGGIPSQANTPVPTHTPPPRSPTPVQRRRRKKN